MAADTPVVPPARPASSKFRENWGFLICLGTSALGVASGFAVFFLALEDQTPLRFFEILATATVLSIIVESLREIIDESGHARRESRPRWSSILVSLLIVGLSELFALGWHAFIGLYGTTDFEAATTILQGGALSASHASRSGLEWLASLWLVSGMALGGVLSFGIERSNKPLGERMGTGAAMGGIVGALLAPLVLLAYVLFVNLLQGLYLLAVKPQDWLANFHTLQHATSGLGVPGMVIGGILWVADQALTFLGHVTDRAPLIVVALIIGGGIYGIREKAGPLAWVVLFCGIALTMTPLLPAVGGLFLLLVRTGLIWAIPGVVLGALVPLLERPAEVPKWWSSVAFAAAVMLLVITAARFEGRWWLLVPAAGILATGIFVWRTGQVEACWPMLAVSVATIVCGAVMAMQHFATFGGVLGNAYDLSHLPDRIAINIPPDTSTLAQGPSITDIVRQSNLGKPFKILTNSSKDEILASEVKRLRADNADLSTLGPQVEKLTPNTARWQATFAQLQTRMAPYWSGTSQTSPPFKQQLGDVIDVQKTLTTLDGDATKELAATSSLKKAVEDIQRREDDQTVGVLSTLTTPLTEWQQLQVDVWRKSQQLLTRLTPYEQDLQAFLGAPESGGLEQFKARFTAFANDTYLQVCRWLELGLAGSFGFWTTLGLLAGWALLRGDAQHA